eukprot:352096-Chlamydomonas_euryale.AAC.5
MCGISVECVASAWNVWHDAGHACRMPATRRQACQQASVNTCLRASVHACNQVCKCIAYLRSTCHVPIYLNAL